MHAAPGFALRFDVPRRRILARTDLATLDGWLDRALRVASMDELLG